METIADLVIRGGKKDDAVLYGSEQPCTPVSTEDKTLPFTTSPTNISGHVHALPATQPSPQPDTPQALSCSAIKRKKRAKNKRLHFLNPDYLPPETVRCILNRFDRIGRRVAQNLTKNQKMFNLTEEKVLKMQNAFSKKVQREERLGEANKEGGEPDASEGGPERLSRWQKRKAARLANGKLIRTGRKEKSRSHRAADAEKKRQENDKKGEMEWVNDVEYLEPELVFEGYCDEGENEPTI